jgi:hypothetical protein
MEIPVSAGWIDNRQIIPLEQSKCKIVFLNPNQVNVHIIEVDRMLDFPGLKCDYLLLPHGINIAHFVELKRSKWKKAVEQLENTIINISLPDTGFERCAYIVCISLLPKHKSTQQISQRRFDLVYNCKLSFGEKSLTADIHSCEEI